MMDGRARITPVDVAWFGVAILFLMFLVGPTYELLNANVSALGTGDAYLLRMIFPAALIGIFVLVMATAVGGE